MMAGITQIEINEQVPIVLQLADGAIDQYPRATIYDTAHNLLVTRDLAHSSNGTYIPSVSYAMPDETFVSVVYVVFSDAGHTIESLVYERDLDIFEQVYPDNYKSTGFAVPNEYDARLLAIQLDLDTPDQYKANVSGLAPANEYDVVLNSIQTDAEEGNFNGCVHVSQNYGSPGTAYPLGTATHPVDNLADAITIAQARNLCRICVEGSHTLVGSIAGYCLKGCTGTSGRAKLNLNGQNIDNCCFSHLIIEGTCNGYAQYEDSCALQNLTNFEGVVRNSDAFTSNPANAIEFKAGGVVTFSRVCAIGCDVYVKPGTPSCAALHNFCGRLHIQEMTGGVFTICSSTSQVVIYDTCIGGTINICGNILVTDNSGPGCTVNDTTVRPPLTAIQANQEIRNSSINDAAPTATSFNTALTEARDDYWNRGAVKMTFGQNDGIIRKIQNYDALNGRITLRTALSYVPANGDTFTIIPARCFRLNWDDMNNIETYVLTSEGNVRGPDSDNLKDLSDQLDTVQADLDTPDQYKADVSALALEATSQLIKERTDRIPDTPAPVSEYDLILAGIMTEVAGLNGDSIPSTADVTAAIFAKIVEGTLSFNDYQRIMFAMLSGTSSGHEVPGPKVYKSDDGLTDRVAFTCDADGNRLSRTLDPA